MCNWSNGRRKKPWKSSIFSLFTHYCSTQILNLLSSNRKYKSLTVTLTKALIESICSSSLQRSFMKCYVKWYKCRILKRNRNSWTTCTNGQNRAEELILSLINLANIKNHVRLQPRPRHVRSRPIRVPGRVFQRWIS